METTELEKKLGVSPTQLTPTSAVQPEPETKDNDFLHLLENTFFTPVLSLVKIYLTHSNGTKKTDANCMLEFRNHHKLVFKIFFILDFFFRLVYMSVVLLVVIRGLAIDEYIIQLFGN